MVLILHDIRSAHNVGAIFRTADAVGVNKIYLTGYTPAPVDRFGRVNKEIAKTALGAETGSPWEKIENVSDLIRKLKAENYQLVALEQTENSVDYKTLTLKTHQGESSVRLAVIVGNEVEGIAPEILNQCDAIAEIPMKGKKESLNVAVAAGVALFRWLDK